VKESPADFVSLPISHHKDREIVTDDDSSYRPFEEIMPAEPPPKLDYAQQPSSKPRHVPWTLAILAWLLLFAPWPVEVLMNHSPALASSPRAALLLMLTSVGGGAGSITCGVFGRRYAIRSGAYGARWVALIGSLFGIVVLVTQSIPLISLIVDGRLH
jgi:hypothetical protein